MIGDNTQDRILLVDSDDRFRERIGGILSDYGFEVVHARSSPTALEEVSRRKPSLCLLETNLAGVDGIQLLRYFRSRHLFRLLPVVILTSGIVKRDLVQLVKLEVKGIFVKSEFSMEALLKKVQELTTPVEILGIFRKESTSDSYSFPDVPSSLHAPIPCSSGTEDTPPSAEHPALRLLDVPAMESLVELKTISVILDELVSVASRSNSSLDDLEAVVRKDPIVAGRLIRAANSAAFLRGAPVIQIGDSLRVLGFSNVVRVALAGGCLSQAEFDGEAGADLKEIWSNSLCMAMVAEKLSNRQDAAKHYMQAILCNLPILFLIGFLGSDWFVWKRWAAGKGLSFGELLEHSTGMSLTKYVDHFFHALKIAPEVSRPLVDY